MKNINCTININSEDESVTIVPVLKKPARDRRVRVRQILKIHRSKNDWYSHRLFSKANTHELFKVGNLEVNITQAFHVANTLNSGQVTIKTNSIKHLENCSISVNGINYKFSDLIVLAPLVGVQYMHLKYDYLHMLGIDNITIEFNKECTLIFIRFNMETEINDRFNYTWGIME